jgi:hypothetical protein
VLTLDNLVTVDWLVGNTEWKFGGSRFEIDNASSWDRRDYSSVEIGWAVPINRKEYGWPVFVGNLCEGHHSPHISR